MTPYKPAGWPSVIPRIVTHDLTGLAGFLRDAFDATGEVRSGAPTEIRIGDAVILISDGGGMPAFLYVYVPNADETYRRAIAAGAASIDAARGYALLRQARDGAGCLGKCLADRDVPAGGLRRAATCAH